MASIEGAIENRALQSRQMLCEADAGVIDRLTVGKCV
jgi:hypothetical protein